MTGEAPPEGIELQACLRELSGLLWRERIALDRLADHLVAGEPDTEADALYRSLSALELHRAIAARETAVELGVTGEPTLGQLAAASPLGWADVLLSHRRALIDLTNEVTHLVRPQKAADGTEAPKVNGAAGPDGAGSSGQRPGVQRSLRDFLA